MVALTISLLLLAGIMQVYIGSKQVYRNNEALARMQAQGRFALDLLAREIRHAGFNINFEVCGPRPFKYELTPCPDTSCNLGVLQSGFFRVALNCVDNAGNLGFSADSHCDVLQRIPFFQGDASTVLGFDPAGASNLWTPPTLDPPPLANTDVIAITSSLRPANQIQVTAHPGGNPPGSANIQADADAVDCPKAGETQPPGTLCIEPDDILIVTTESCDAGAIFQVSAGNPAQSGSIPHNRGKGSPGNRTNALGRDFTGGSLMVLDAGAVTNQTIYYVALNGNGRNALYRSTDEANGVELLDGIQDMQITYGEDADNDQQVDAYRTADAVTDWADVLSVRVSLLVESQDTNVMDLPQTLTFNGATVDTSDRRLRQVFTTTVAVRNRLP
ncbi:MAG: PilW family protein [Chromatiales bacterium]|nr:PilW family protein [Chromatiales bacterium]